jgi:DNA-binding MarR family transcriptional regulator
VEFGIKKPKRSKSVQGPHDYNGPVQLDPLLQDDLDYLIRTLRFRLVQVIEKMLGNMGLALSAWYPLSLLAGEDGISQRELGLRLGLKDAAIGKAVESMEKEGLVVRQADTRDRRKILVHLTPTGRKTAQKVIDQRRQILTTVLAGFSTSEVSAYQDMLKRSHANLTKFLD